MKTSLALCLLALALFTLAACDTVQRKAIGKRLGQDAAVAASAAAGAAERETLNELQSGGKVDSSAIGASAGTAAMTALVQLDAARASAKAPGK